MEFIDKLIPLLPFMVCLFWTVHAGAGYRDLNRAQRNLGLFLAASTVLFLYHAVYYSAAEAPEFGVLALFYSWSTLTVYPLYYLYIKAITDSRRPGWGELSVLFVPGILAAAAGAAVIACGLRREVLDWFITAVRPVQAVAVCVLSLVKLNTFDHTVFDTYSEVEGKTTRPVMVLVALQLAASVGTVVLSLLGQKFFLGKGILALPSLLFAGVIYAIAYVGFRYRFGADQLEKDLKEEGTAEKEHDDSALYAAILDKMENGRIFLQPGLSVMDLAEATGSNRTYVSTSINTHSGKSFALFVNEYRVEYAMSLMQEDRKLSVTQVGEMSGFASEESFRRNFRALTGKSPSAWAKGVKD